MSQKRKLKRSIARTDGNVIHLPLPKRGSNKHEFVEQLLLAAIEAAANHPGMEVAPIDALTALLRVTANAAASIGVPKDSVVQALEVHYDREAQAVAEMTDKDPGPNAG